MDITVYLPDATGAWAKERQLNLSALLRGAVEAEMEQAKAVAAAVDGMEPQRIELENDNGDAYTGRFVGKLLAQGRGADVYLTEDERVLVHDTERGRVAPVEDAGEDLRTLLDDDAYVAACAALGIQPEIDI